MTRPFRTYAWYVLAAALTAACGTSLSRKDALSGPNRAPVARDGVTRAVEDVLVAGELEAVDPDGDALEYAVAQRAESRPALQVIDLSPANDPPVGPGQDVATEKNLSALGKVTAVDPEGDVLVFSLGAPPARGSVSVNPLAGEYEYVPAANYTGDDAFVITARDPGGLTASIPVRVRVGAETFKWHNPDNRFDVNKDNLVSPIDV